MLTRHNVALAILFGAVVRYLLLQYPPAAAFVAGVIAGVNCVGVAVHYAPGLAGLAATYAVHPAAAVASHLLGDNAAACLSTVVMPVEPVTSSRRLPHRGWRGARRGG